MPFQGQLRPGAEEAVGHRLIREFTITPYKPSPKPPKVRESQILGTTSHIPPHCPGNPPPVGHKLTVSMDRGRPAGGDIRRPPNYITVVAA